MTTHHIHRFSTCLYTFFNLSDAIDQIKRTEVEILVTEIEKITVGQSAQQAFFTVIGTQEQVDRLQTIVAYLEGEGVRCYELGCPRKEDWRD